MSAELFPEEVRKLSAGERGDKAPGPLPSKILLVEDQPGDARLVVEALKEVNETGPFSDRLELDTVESCAAARAAIDKGSYRAVLLDLDLPDSRGLETVKAIRRTSTALPLIVLTGNADHDMAVAALHAGAQDYLFKGRIDGEDLRRAIRYAVGRQSVAARLEEQETFTRSILSSLHSNIAVLDPVGTILDTNEAWLHFGLNNGADRTTIGPGVNYLEVCRAAVRQGDELAQRAHDLILDVLRGATEFASLEYPCHSPDEERWFTLHVTPLEPDRSGAVVAHEDITERRRAEGKLARREQQLRTLLDNSPDVVARYDLEGRHLYVSPAVEEQTGRPAEEYLGKTNRELAVPADRESAWRLARERLQATGQRQMLEFEVRGNDGPRTYRTEMLPEYSSDGELESILAISHDVTDLQRANEQLRGREAVLESVNFAAERYLSSSDWRRETPKVLARLGEAIDVDRAYLWRNQQAEGGELLASQLYEWVGREEYRQSDPAMLRDVPYGSGGFRRWQETLADGGVIKGSIADFPAAEREFLTSQSIQSLLVVPVYVGAKWWGFIGFDDCHREREWEAQLVDALRTASAVLGDAIARERAERELALRERRFRALVENSWDAVALVDLDGTVRYASPSTEHVLGISSEVLIGRNGFSLIHPEDRDLARRSFEAVARGDQEPGILELRIRREDGEWRWVEATASNLLGDPAFKGMVVNYRDITESKLARDALEANERRFRSLVQNASDIITVVDESGTIIYESPAIERSLGYPVEEVVGQEVLTAVHPEDRAEAKSAFEEILIDPDAEMRIKLRLQGKDGEFRHLEVVGVNRLADPAVQGIILNARDVTVQHLAEERLKEREEKYRLLAENAIDVIWQMDRRLNFTYVSPSIQEMFGYTQEEYIGTNLAEHTSWKEFHKLARQALRTFRDYPDFSPVTVDTVLYRKDGTEIEVEVLGEVLTDEEGTILGVHGSTRDISARKAAESASRESEERFRSLFRSIRDAMLVADTNRRIVQVNPAFEELFGYSAEEIVGAETSKLVVDTDDFWEVGKNLAATGHGEIATTLNYRKKSGEIFTGETKIYGLWNSEHELVGYVGQTRDISYRLRQEREQEAIVQVAAALRDAEGREEMPPIILQQIMKLLDAGGAAITTYGAETGKLIVELATGSWSATSGMELSENDEIERKIYRTGEPYQHRDARQDPQFVGAELLGPDTAAVGVPLRAHGQPLGTLWAGRDRPFSEGEIRILSAVADMAANALRRAGLHEETERRAEQMVAVSRLGQSLAEYLDEFAIYERLVAVTKDLLPEISTVIISRYEEERQRFRYVLGDHEGEPIDIAELGPVDLEPTGQGCQREAVRTKRAVIRHDLGEPVEGDPRATYGGGERPAASEICVPMMAEGRAIGVIHALSYQENQFNRLDAEVMTLAANTAAVALENADLVRDLQGSTIELAMAYDTTLEGWARALELRDKETEGHARRVTDLTVQLAVHLDVPAEELVHYRRGALLHDIGKMGIPDDILLKPDKLTEDEWEIMRQHPVLAYEMLEEVEFLRSALEIPLYHHERWDGSGYPEGLRGDQIPLAARVFAVIDVYDALGSDRPYREAWPAEKVHDYLRENRGVLFDPHVVDAFFTNLEE